MRQLTTVTSRCSARVEVARRRRNRRRRRTGVEEGNGELPAIYVIPACTAWRGRRGGRGAAPGGGDSAMACWNSGNGGSTASTETVAARVWFLGLDSARGEKNPRQRGRGVRGASYPRARRLGMDGIGVGRGSSDRAGRRNRGRGRQRRFCSGPPGNFSGIRR